MNIISLTIKRIFIVLLSFVLLITVGCMTNNNGVAGNSGVVGSSSIANSSVDAGSSIVTGNSGDAGNTSQLIEYRKISAEQANDMMSEDKPFILLDVRTDEEFKEKRIEGAILIPDYEVGERAADELPDKDAVILIYCRSGRRSANAAHALIDMGYTNILDFGGINDWPYDTVSG